MPIRVALGDDNLIVREGLSRLLENDPDVEIVATAGDLGSLREACEVERPDVVITDIRMPPTHTNEGIRLAAELRENHPSTGVVVLSQYSDPSYALELLDRGADGRAYLLKDRVYDGVQLMAAIRAVATGSSMVDPSVFEALFIARARRQHSPLNELTPRERDVLGEIAQGKSNEAIAQSLFLTKRGVEKHINSVFLKLGLAETQNVSKRVKATLMLLAESGAIAAPEGPPQEPPVGS